MHKLKQMKLKPRLGAIMPSGQEINQACITAAGAYKGLQ